MDDKKSKQEQLFLKAREICKDMHIETANALDMSQYSILGDETYNLDYISKIDMSTPRGSIENSEFMKRYKAVNRQSSKSIMSNNLVLSYIDYVDDLKLRSIEPVMSFDEYVISISSYIKELWSNLSNVINNISEAYNKSLPIKNKFVFILPDDKILIVSRGKLLSYTFTIFAPLYPNIQDLSSLFEFTYRYISSTSALANLKSLRKRIKIKRIKKR